MAETTPTRAQVLEQVPDERAESLDVDGWAQLLTRAGERLSSPARTRLATGAGRARGAGVPLATVIDVWMAVADATRAGRDPAVHLRLVGDGTRALCAGYGDGLAEAVARTERERALLLDELLSEAPVEQVQERAARLGVDLSGRRSVIVIGVVADHVLERLLDAGALAGPRAGTVVGVVAGRVPRGPETAGLGRPGLGITGIRASFAEARRALDLATRLGLRGVVPIGDVLPEAVVARDQEALRELVEATLAPLRSTRNGGPQYVETASVWLQEGLSVAATARTLDVHERTIRYRLARIAKLTALDLQHADDRFRLELAIRGARLLDAEPAG